MVASRLSLGTRAIEIKARAAKARLRVIIWTRMMLLFLIRKYKRIIISYPLLSIKKDNENKLIYDKYLYFE